MAVKYVLCQETLLFAVDFLIFKSDFLKKNDVLYYTFFWLSDVKSANSAGS